MIQKSIPLFFGNKPPHSAVAKKLLREILSNANDIQLHPEEVKELMKKPHKRKRVFLSPKQDHDLIEFFYTAPKSVQWVVFYQFNKKLQEEVKP